MKARLLLVVALILLASIVVGEAHLAARRENELTALRRRAAELAAEANTLQSERQTAAAELSEAQRQRDALPAANPSGSGHAATARGAETAAWLGRVKQLRSLLASRPADRIPEMRLLTEQDWLRVTRTSELESDEGRRRALAALRSAAMEQFAQQLRPALRNFAKTAPSASPAGAEALAAFFSPPIDPRVLERYELIDHRAENQPQWEWTVQNKTPLDPDFEWRHRISVSANGGFAQSSGHGPWMWIPDLPGRLDRANNAYREANPGKTAAGIADILPFVNPPLSSATAAKLIEESRQPWR